MRDYVIRVSADEVLEARQRVDASILAGEEPDQLAWAIAVATRQPQRRHIAGKGLFPPKVEPGHEDWMPADWRPVYLPDQDKKGQVDEDAAPEVDNEELISVPESVEPRITRLRGPA